MTCKKEAVDKVVTVKQLPSAILRRPEGHPETLLSDEEMEDLDRAIDLSWIT